MRCDNVEIFKFKVIDLKSLRSDESTSRWLNANCLKCVGTFSSKIHEIDMRQGEQPVVTRAARRKYMRLFTGGGMSDASRKIILLLFKIQ